MKNNIELNNTESSNLESAFYDGDDWWDSEEYDAEFRYHNGY